MILSKKGGRQRRGSERTIQTFQIFASVVVRRNHQFEYHPVPLRLQHQKDMVSASGVESEEYVVLDFETTGLHPQRHRVIEVGAYIVRNHQVIDSFSSLCNPGCKLPPFIVRFTGITDAMLIGQPTPEQVMKNLNAFLGNRRIIAHNAAFDSKFLAAEMKRAGHKAENQFICSLLLSRRIFPHIKSHKLGNLQQELGITVNNEHRSHRALDDAFVTVALFSKLIQTMRGHLESGIIDWSLLLTVSKLPKAKVFTYLLSCNQNIIRQMNSTLRPTEDTTAPVELAVDIEQGNGRKSKKRKGSLFSAFSSAKNKRKSRS